MGFFKGGEEKKYLCSNGGLSGKALLERGEFKWEMND